ncbi:MAG: LysM peptidoglycan-binding domain-containing protein [Flavobacterium sp.]|jgi:membrane-bound lytic murein transglycosylase D|uniref:lytic transglycosylase domain-containing protein n=1 Tax=Flavobacterium sp. TaxID=239 RepID=UPI0025B949A2|nr:lytic transglycosylase domain-containing protein [Flavobacterium sp.]MCA1965357.1 LysM peptidoglycan-binding domain-containing protein [Flavobacterium sp.]
MKKTIIITSLFLSLFSFAQESVEKESLLPLPKMSYLDSLKTTFVNHSTSNCIDERWISELASAELSENMFSDIVSFDIDSEVSYDLSSELLKKRLAKMDAKSPFNIEYHPALENTIKAFLKNRTKAFERLMAISEYYFPMFEEHLAKYNIPLELKYLAIVESALNPRAKSRVGASGLWQFMYPTGKQYNLEVSSYVDERYDPLKATEAACQYLSSLYGIFGDWSMVLAAYNCGPGNVSKAIRRSGGSQNYWNIRKNLPKETANYVPAFLATFYIYEFKKEHGIVPKKAPITYFETDTIMVKKQMSFKQISELLDIPMDQLEFLNPIYKLKVVPFEADEPHYLRLPKNKMGLFVSNEEKIYAYLNYLETDKEKTNYITSTSRDSVSSSTDSAYVSKPKFERKTHFHTIKSGESLGKIADKYNVSISELKKWNSIKGNTIQAGKKLKIYSDKKVIAKTESKSNNDGTYTVKSGDSLFSISKQFPGVSIDDIKKWNDISGDNIQPGMKLKING